MESAAQLADEMANVRTVVPDADIAQLTDEVQALSRASGIGTTDLTAGLYDLVSAGVPAGEAMGVLAASTNLAIGGLGTTAGAADVVTSALNAYGEGADQATRVTDIFALAIQKGKVTADEIGSSIANIAPVAAAAGVSLEEVGAGYAQLTAKGVPAAQAATQMRAAISALLTPNESLNKLQEQTGKNFADIAREKGLAVALEELRQATANNATELDKLAGISAEDFPDALKAAQAALGLTNTEVEKFSAMAGKDGAGAALAELTKEVGVGESAFGKSLGSIEAYQFALNTTGDSADSFQGQITDMFAATGTSAEQAAIKMDSPVEAGKRLFATFATFAQDVGGPFASSLGPILFGLNQLSPAMRGLISPARLAGGAIGALATKGLPKLFGVLQTGARNIPTALGYFDLFASKAKGLGSKLLPALTKGLGGAFAAVVPMLAGAISGVVTGIGGLFAAAMPLLVAALPFLIAGAIIAGIVLLIVNPEIRDAVFGFIGGVIGWIGDALGGLGDFLGGIFGDAFGAIGDVIGTVIAPFVEIFDTIGDIWGGLVALFTGGEIFEDNPLFGFVKAVRAAFDAVATFVGSAIGVIMAPIQAFIGFLGTVWNGVVGAAEFVWNAIGAIVKTAIDVITFPIRTFIGFLGTLWNGAVAAAKFVWDSIGSIVTTAFAIITAPIRIFIDFLAGLWNGATEAATSVWDTISSVVSSTVGVITGILNGLIGVVGGVWDAVSGFFTDVFGGAEKAKQDLLGVKNYAGKPNFFPAPPVQPPSTGKPPSFKPVPTATPLFSKPFGKPIPLFGLGAWETADELAYLHAGEMVLPPSLAESFRRFLGGEGEGMASARPQARESGDGGGNTIVEHMEVMVPIQGLLRAERPSDVADTLRRAARLGYLTPRPVRAS